MAETRTLEEDRLTCAGRHVVDDWEHDLDTWFSFGAEGLVVGGDGDEGEEGLQGFIPGEEPLAEAGDGGVVGTEDDDEVFVLSFGASY